MLSRILPKEMTEEALKDFLIHVHEKYYIELKKAENLPAAFWESYSSFSNTRGGYIILGVREAQPDNEIVGVGNAEKILTDLWNHLSNTNKVSFRNIDNDDVHTYNVEGKNIIIIKVKESPERMKPVYTGGKFENSWIRTGDGDRKATTEELKAFMRNAQPGEDTLIAEQFTLEDLDMDSVLAYRTKVNNRYPSKNYKNMEIPDFLVEIGAAMRDRTTGKLLIKRGTLLFFGMCNSIKELYPHYHVDFFSHKGNNPRWSDRVSDDEPNDSEMNLYNFFRIVYEKIKFTLQEPFSLDQQQIRIPVADFDETVRECLVNCLAHADYMQGYPSTKIDLYDGWFCFLNPGKMLISTEQFVVGGDSRPRNEIIMKLFRMLGLSERQGFGGPLIYKTATNHDLRRPEVVTDLEHTEIKIWNIDVADSYPNLTPDEKCVFRCIVKHQPQSVNAIKEALDMTEYKVRKTVQSLETQGLVEKVGNGASTKYIASMNSMEFLTKIQMMLDAMKKQIGQDR